MGNEKMIKLAIDNEFLKEFADNINAFYLQIASNDLFKDNESGDKIRDSFAPIGVFSAAILLALSRRKEDE